MSEITSIGWIFYYRLPVTPTLAQDIRQLDNGNDNFQFAVSTRYRNHLLVINRDYKYVITSRLIVDQIEMSAKKLYRIP